MATKTIKSDSHSDLLVCDAVSLGEWLPTCWRWQHYDYSKRRESLTQQHRVTSWKNQILKGKVPWSHVGVVV